MINKKTIITELRKIIKEENYESVRHKKISYDENGGVDRTEIVYYNKPYKIKGISTPTEDNPYLPRLFSNQEVLPYNGTA